jgi:DNA repair protein RecN (Recombination protein N)
VVGADEDGGGAISALATAEVALQGVRGVDAKLDSIFERVSAAAVELGDLAGELREYLEGIDADPGRLAVLEERLEAIDRLKRKHGGTVELVLAHAERSRAVIEELENAEERGAEAEVALREAEALRTELSVKLSKGRAKAAPLFQKKVAAELERLAMPGATLEVVLEPHRDGFGLNGTETVELRLAPNPGIAPGPLRDAASGGELSRVMLALTGLGEGAGAATLVFDEIDAGIGGNTARVVGERLRALGEGRQVICITHLPQVASLATTHFRLEKDIAGERATATVQRLDGEEVVAEIRRMLGGESSDEAATRHARELLAAA